MMTIDLQKQMGFPISKFMSEEVTSVVVQPLSILLVSASKIGFFKLTTTTFANSTSSCIAPEGVFLESVTFAEKNPGFLFANNKHSLHVFEAKMQDKNLTCELRASFEVPSNLAIKDLHLVASRKMIYVSFQNSNVVGILKFDF